MSKTQTKDTTSLAFLTGWILFALYLLTAGGALFFGGNAPHQLSYDWVPALGLNIDFYIGQFQLWFIVLILAISGAVQLYASNYYAGKPQWLRLLITLQIFTLAMIGIVATDNLFMLFIFWEATSMCSFLLVGMHHESAENARKAAQGLMITMLGGVGLLLAGIFLQQAYGTVSVQALRNMEFQHSFASYTGMACILLACLTKSAQFPFHFWLPNAMAGPTPVSALLHSATMVKAGVYLLAMFAPLFSQCSAWGWILIPSGAVTLAISNMMGLTTKDLKTVYASTTLAALGALTMLAGVGTEYALKGFVIFLTAHALYKAPLFLSAGVIETACGSRQLSDIQGVARRLPLLGVLVGISLLSMFGLPPFLGFLGKEYALKAFWQHSSELAILAALLLAGATGVGVRAFWYMLKTPEAGTVAAEGKQGKKVASLSKQKKQAAHAKLSAVSLPVVISVLLLVLYPFSSEILKLAGADLSQTTLEKAKAYKFWEGWSPALFLSIGVLASVYSASLGFKFLAGKIKLNGNAMYECTINGILNFASLIRKQLGDGRLRSHLSVMLFCITTLTLLEIAKTAWIIDFSSSIKGLSMFSLILPILIIASIYAAVSKRVIPVLIALGIIGLLIAIIFLWFSAPDLALTQLLAEILILFLLVGVILKKNTFTKEKKSHLRKVIAIGTGLMTTLLVLQAQSLEWDKQTSLYYLEKSYAEAFGKNVVNVILVDFRAIDTLGEVTVLAIAALGVTAAFGAARKRASLSEITRTPWMRCVFQILLWVMVPIALMTLYRGHNAPGGGFIAALLASIWIGFGMLIGVRQLSNQTLRILSRRCLIIGLSLALLPVFLSAFVGKSIMQGMWLHFGDFHIGTPVVFDIGVFLTVVGFVVQYLRHFMQPQDYSLEPEEDSTSEPSTSAEQKTS